MEKREYLTLYRLEDEHWWFIALRGFIRALGRDIFKSKDLTILDAGCGTGAFARELGRGNRVVALDYSPDALEFCAKRNLVDLIRASINEIPVRGESMDAVFSISVLEMEGVDQARSIGEFHRVLKTGGTLVLMVPAHRWLASEHDAAVHSVQRMTKSRLKEFLLAAGFEIERLTYGFMFLFPVIAGIRMLKSLAGGSKSRAESKSDLRPANGIVNWLLAGLCEIEALALAGLNLPMGVDLFVRARKTRTVG